MSVMRFGVRAFDSLEEEIEKPNVAFSSGNTVVASVDSGVAAGLALGLAPGETTISASVGDAKADARLRVLARTLVINEVLADPPVGLAGDANHDGTRSGSDDEFVELVNGSGDVLDVGGWTLRTRPLTGGSESVRHSFPNGSRIPAGEALVLFGGGNPNPDDPVFGGALVGRVSSSSLSLTNAGLTIQVCDAAGNLVTQFSYGTGNALARHRRRVRSAHRGERRAQILARPPRRRLILPRTRGPPHARHAHAASTDHLHGRVGAVRRASLRPVRTPFEGRRLQLRVG